MVSWSHSEMQNFSFWWWMNRGLAKLKDLIKDTEFVSRWFCLDSDIYMTPISVLRCALPNNTYFRRVTCWTVRTCEGYFCFEDVHSWRIHDLFSGSFQSSWRKFSFMSNQNEDCFSESSFPLIWFFINGGNTLIRIILLSSCRKNEASMLSRGLFLFLAHWLSSLWIHTFFLNWLQALSPLYHPSVSSGFDIFFPGSICAHQSINS